MTYTFSFRKSGTFFWNHLKKSKGHQYEKEGDQMTVFFQHGGLQTIRNWSQYELKLGRDFGIFMEEQIKKETQGGQIVSFNKGRA